MASETVARPEIGRIYAIRDARNGKVYVGQTRRTLTHRAREHWNFARNGKNHPLFRAMRKRPADFSFEELLEAPVDMLDAVERDLISLARSLHPNGYNLRYGGSGEQNRPEPSQEKRERMRAARLGKKASAETRARMSAAQRGRKMPPGFAEKTRQRMLGTKVSTETRCKLSESHKGYVPTEAQRAKLSAAFKGRAPSRKAIEKLAEYNATRGSMPTEQREKLRRANLGKKQSPELLEKRRIAMLLSPIAAAAAERRRGRTVPESTREKMRAAHSTPEARAKAATAMRGKSHSPETKAKMKRSQEARRAREKRVT